MLQYGKPINKNSKSGDLKMECACLGTAAMMPHLPGFLRISPEAS
jgi:hypothetical protein